MSEHWGAVTRDGGRFAWVGFLTLLAMIPARGQGVTLTGHVTLIDPGAPPKQAAGNTNVVVWLTPLSVPGGGPQEIQPLHNPPRFRLIQRQKQFEPHLLVVPLGAVVEFPNLDPFFHNVFSLFEGKRFDLGLYEAGTTRSVKFDRPGVSYIFCNIHAEMSAVVVAVKTPYYGVSDRSGDIRIPNVLPGRYLLEVWHERALPEVLRSIRHEITVPENSAFIGNIQLSVSGELLPAHKNKYGRDYDKPTPSGYLFEQP